MDTKFTKSAGGINDGLNGAFYQVRLLMLFAYRARQKNLTFQLGTEIKEAGKFDDLLFKYESKEHPNNFCFLQAKFKKNPKKMGLETLLTDNNYKLGKYFRSFRELRETVDLEDIQEVVICTNNVFDFTKIEPTENLFKLQRSRDERIFFEQILEDHPIFGQYEHRYRFVSDHSKDNREITKKVLLAHIENYNLLAAELAELIVTRNVQEIPYYIKKYSKHLTRFVFDVSTSQFRRDFLDGLDPNLNCFREAFETSFKKVMNSNITTLDKELRNRLKRNFWGHLSEVPLDLGFLVGQDIAEEIVVRLEAPAPLDNIPARGLRGPKLDSKHVRIDLAGNSQSLGNEILQNLECQIETMNTVEHSTPPYDFTLSSTALGPSISQSAIDEFLDKLVFITNLTEDNIESLMKGNANLNSRISKIHNLTEEFNITDIDMILKEFEREILYWIKNSEKVFLDDVDIEEIFSGVKSRIFSLHVTGLQSEILEEFEDDKVRFRDDVEKLDEFLACPDLQIFLMQIESQDFSIQKVRMVQAVDGKCQALLTKSSLSEKNLNLIVDTFGSSEHSLLIYDHPESGGSKDLLNKILRILELNPSKKSIILSGDPGFDKYVKNNFKDNKKILFQKMGKLRSSDLLPESISHILDQKVMFQGVEISLGSLISPQDIEDQPISEFYKLESPIIGEDLFEHNRIGSRKDVATKGYRKELYMERRVYCPYRVRTEVIKDKLEHRFLGELAFNREEFLRMKKECPGKNIHWLEILEFDCVQEDQLGQQKDQLGQQKDQLGQQKDQLGQQKDQLGRQEDQLGQQKDQLGRQKDQLGQQSDQLRRQEDQLGQQKDQLGDQKDIKVLEWKKTYGNSEEIEKYFFTLTLSEEELIQARTQHPIVIADQAGMGKSTLFTSISMKLKEKNPDFWITRINLNDVTEELQKVKDSKDLKDPKILDLFIKLIGIKTNLEKLIFQTIFTAKKGLCVIFDGFDEICPYYEDTVIEMVKYFSSNHYENLFVTSRPECCAKLNESLTTRTYSMVPLTEADQKGYLHNYWKAKYSFNETIFHKFSTNILTGIYTSLNDHKSLFVGNPLILSMIADIYEKDLKDIESSNISIEEWLLKIENFQPNITNLFGNFVRQKYDVYFKDKFQMDLTKAAARMIYQKLEKDFNRMHTILALKTIFSATDFEIFNKDIKFQDDDDFDCVYKGGIVHKMENIIRFIHKTFAEYFVALFFLQHFQQYKDFIVQKVLVSSDFRIVRVFINSELESYNGALGNVEGIFELLAASDTSKDVEKDEITPLHIAAKEKDLKTLNFLFESLVFQDTTKESCKNVLLQPDKDNGNLIIHYYLQNCSDDFQFLLKIKETLGFDYLMVMLAAGNGCSENALFFANRRGNLLGLLDWLKRLTDVDGKNELLCKLISHKNVYGYNVLRYLLSAYLNEAQVLEQSCRIMRWISTVMGKAMWTDVFFLHRDSQLTFLHNLVLSCANKKDFPATFLAFLQFLKVEMRVDKTFLLDLFLHEDIHLMNVIHLYVFETPHIKSISENLLKILAWIKTNLKFDENYAFCLFTTPAYDGVNLLKRLSSKCPDYEDFICELQLFLGKGFDLSFIENMDP